MVAGSFTEVYESPIAPARLWKAYALDAHVWMPELLSKFVASVDVIGGDGGVGTVKQFNFTALSVLFGFHGVAVKEHGFVKDRVDVLDAENHVFKYTVIEGGMLLSRLKSYSYELKFEAAAGGACKGTVTVEYETENDNPLTAEEGTMLTVPVDTVRKALEQYLQANPGLYA